MNVSELSNCPEKHGAHFEQVVPQNGTIDQPSWRVYCDDWDCWSGPIGMTRKKAAAAWNQAMGRAR